MSNHLFQPATKQQARARVAFSGASGSGKTFWALTWATALAEGQPIAVIDTERGSASLYADQFKFDVLEMRPPYHPDRLVEALNSATNAGYKVVVVDSLTHFWSGQGGTLEIVDQASARFKGNSHAAWQVGTPIQQRMIDALLGFDGHLMATMRAKTEWVMEPDERGNRQTVWLLRQDSPQRSPRPRASPSANYLRLFTGSPAGIVVSDALFGFRVRQRDGR